MISTGRTQRRLFEDSVGVRRRITEKVLAGDGQSRVDREAGVIRDCAILGKESANGRVYEDPALEKAVGLYEGMIVRVNHKPGEKRSVCEDIGVLRNIRRDGDKVRGDFHYIKAHNSAEYFCERAEKFPETFGFSHEADGLVDEGDGGIQRVIDLIFVESVDLVGTPATNMSLFEEKRTMVRKSIRSVIRGVPAKTPGRSRMLEMINDPATEGDVEVSKEATPEEELDASLKAAIQAILGDDTLNVDEKLSKIAALCGDNIPEEGPAEPPADPEPKPKPEEVPTTESTDVPAGDVEKMTESITKKVMQRFQGTLEQQNQLIKKLVEENAKITTQNQQANEEKIVRKLFEDSGVKAPTQEQVDTAVTLKGRQRESYVSTVKTLVESESAGGPPRSSGSGVGGLDPIGSFPTSSDDFVKALR